MVLDAYDFSDFLGVGADEVLGGEGCLDDCAGNFRVFCWWNCD